MREERQVVIAGERASRLVGMLHLPVGRPRRVFIFCHPFAEEKKCGHRALVNMARRLARDGDAALRFDFDGCGDSEGEFVAATLSSWEADVAAAAAWLRAETGAQRLAFLGLRLGAAIALRACRADADPELLALWQPVTDGEEYAAENMRRGAIRRMLIFGEGRAAAQELPQELREGRGEMDFDGYRLGGPLYRELCALKLGPLTPPVPTLLLQAGPRPAILRRYRELAEEWRNRGAAVSLRAVVAPPIWNRLELEDPTPLIDATAEWLNQSATARQ